MENCYFCNFQVGESSATTVETHIPVLPLQWTWLHSCVAISCDKNQTTLVRAVFNGVNVLNGKTIQSNENTSCPTSLDGNLVLHKLFANAGYWSQFQGNVTNVNVFSGLMSVGEMVSRTSGEDCGKQDGDFYSWTNSSWSLQGATRWTEVSVEDLCKEFSSIQWLSTHKVTKPESCRHLCQKLHVHGQMSSVETQELYEKFQSRARALNPLLNHDGSNLITAWLPIRRRKNGTWLDDYTNNRISAQWNEGFPTNDPEKSCGIGSLGLGNCYCENTSLGGGLFCSCHFPEYPFLTMRGLCKDSFLDQTYLPQNSPLDGETTFYGNVFSLLHW